MKRRMQTARTTVELIKKPTMRARIPTAREILNTLAFHRGAGAVVLLPPSVIFHLIDFCGRNAKMTNAPGWVQITISSCLLGFCRSEGKGNFKIVKI
jgi:hypothetical protein